MNQRCQTCKHWSLDRYVSKRKYGRCEGVPDHSDTTSLSFPDPREGDALAWTKDAEGYASFLYTMPTFGCVLWEQKREGDHTQ